MKKNVLTKSLFAALLLASTVVTAEEYPAADFQPTVVYSDSASSSESKEASESSASGTEAKAEKAESSNTMLLGLVVLAVAGGFFLSKKSKAPAKKSESIPAPSYSGGTGGQTGVEKYLQAQNVSAATGVEKYLAQKEAADKEASLTGVDKYLRNRG